MSKEKFILATRYNIDTVIYLNEDGITPISKKLPDNRLTKEFLRLYFTGKIEKVWKEWFYDRYWAKTTDGRTIYLKKTHTTCSDIEEIIADKRGGKRQGAGPKSKLNGMATKTMRIPVSLQDKIKCLIDTYINLGSDDDNLKTDPVEDDKRMELINDMIFTLEYDKRKINERRRRHIEEENKKME